MRIIVGRISERAEKEPILADRLPSLFVLGDVKAKPRRSDRLDRFLEGTSKAMKDRQMFYGLVERLVTLTPPGWYRQSVKFFKECVEVARGRAHADIIRQRRASCIGSNIKLEEDSPNEGSGREGEQVR